MRIVEKVSYAEAIEKVKESMGGQGNITSKTWTIQSLGRVPANSFIVDKSIFLDFFFLLENLWAGRQVEKILRC